MYRCTDLWGYAWILKGFRRVRWWYGVLFKCMQELYGDADDILGHLRGVRVLLKGI